MGQGRRRDGACFGTCPGVELAPDPLAPRSKMADGVCLEQPDQRRRCLPLMEKGVLGVLQGCPLPVTVSVLREPATESRFQGRSPLVTVAFALLLLLGVGSTPAFRTPGCCLVISCFPPPQLQRPPRATWHCQVVLFDSFGIPSDSFGL